MKIIHKIFNRLELIWEKPRINILKTIYFNFRTMPLSVAIKFPVFLYGRNQFKSLSGTVKFTCKVRRGIVKIGRNTDCFFADQSSFFFLGGDTKIIFGGPASFGTGTSFRLSGKGKIFFSEYVRSGSCVNFFSEDEIRIGRYTTFTFFCQIMDTNFHYMLDTNKNLVHRKTKPVNIGSFNWIGNRSSIMKGTITKDYTIVCSGSLLNRNYIEKIDCASSVMLAGVPAEFISSGSRLILSLSKEQEIGEYFKKDAVNDFQWTSEMSDNYSDRIKYEF